MKNTALSTFIAGALAFSVCLSSRADVFHAGGHPITTMSAKIQGVDCRLPKDTKFDLAPSPASSASAPVAIVSITAPAPAASGAEKEVAAAATAPANAASAAIVNICPPDTKLIVTADELDSSAKYQEWIIGGAIIPFKVYVSGDNKGVAGNTAAIGYIGYKWHAPGGSVIVGFGAGPTTVSSQAQATSSGGGTSQDSQLSGASVAFLLLGQLGYTSTAQFGIAIGMDKVSSSANWVNNEKPWIGFQIGAKIF